MRVRNIYQVSHCLHLVQILSVHVLSFHLYKHTLARCLEKKDHLKLSVNIAARLPFKLLVKKLGWSTFLLLVLAFSQQQPLLML